MTPSQKNDRRSYLDASRSAAERAEALLAEMTLAEKVAQLGSVYSYDLMDENGFSAEKACRVSDGIGQITRIGTYTLLPPRQRAELANAIQAYLVEHTRLGIPAIIHDECCSGFAAMGATRFTQMIGLASTFRPELAEAMSAIIGRQMRATGTHQGLAPVLDLYRDPRWGRVEEHFGEDPCLVARFGAAYVRGLQGGSLKEGVMATAKHFIAHSASEGGLNCTPVHMGPREIHESFLPAYEAAIREAGAACVMNSYSELDGRVVAADKTILRDLLRGELGFEGLVTSDYVAVDMLHTYHRVAADRVEAAVKALEAGIDQELPETVCYGDALASAVEYGKIDPAVIDESVRRVLIKKFELGLFEQPFAPVDAVEGIYADPAPLKLAREIAEQSLVLLKNEGGLLPLKTSPGTLAVIGPNAADGRRYLGDYSYAAMIEILLAGGPHLRPLLEQTGSPAQYDQELAQIPTLVDAIRERVGAGTRVLYAKGCDNSGEDRSGFAEALSAAKQADVIVLALGDFSGLKPGCTSGEFNDRSTLNLPGVQEDLVREILAAAPGKPVALVLINGRPLALTEIAEYIPAILEAWMPGEQAAPAIADALFGAVNPGGRLPVSLPRSVGQLPIFYNIKPSGGRSNFRWNYIDQSTKALFPFGHGLSYTTFEYSGLQVDSELNPGGMVTVQCDVRNSGPVAGDEVVQMYIQDEYACVPRPVKELKGFLRVRLEPGQTARVQFQLTAEHLAYYDEEMRLVVEPGPILVRVGSSSEDIRQQGWFQVTEEVRVEQRSTQIVGKVN